MEKNRADLAVYRLETARQCIQSAEVLLEISDYKGAANRSHYAIFHCMRSVLALISMDFSKLEAIRIRNCYLLGQKYSIFMRKIKKLKQTS